MLQAVEAALGPATVTPVVQLFAYATTMFACGGPARDLLGSGYVLWMLGASDGSELTR